MRAHLSVRIDFVVFQIEELGIHFAHGQLSRSSDVSRTDTPSNQIEDVHNRLRPNGLIGERENLINITIVRRLLFLAPFSRRMAFCERSSESKSYGVIVCSLAIRNDL